MSLFPKIVFGTGGEYVLKHGIKKFDIVCIISHELGENKLLNVFYISTDLQIRTVKRKHKNNHTGLKIYGYELSIFL